MLVTGERSPPYQRPILSKGYLSGDVPVQDLLIKSTAAYERAAVRMLTGTVARNIDRPGQSVLLSDGTSLHYDRLALVTGGEARRLPASLRNAEEATNFHYLRTLEDASRLKANLLEGKKVVVIGGGYIGLEVAAASAKRGLQTTVIESADRVLARVTAPTVSTFYEAIHRANGVEIRTRTAVARFILTGNRVSGVECTDGTVLPADVVVVGIGLEPNTGLAAAAELDVNDGIIVDEQARTSDPRIVAAGDCTRFYSRLYGRRVRLESVPNALEQARVAAATICGQSKCHDPLPWFWSDQYDLKLKMVGLSAGYDCVVMRGTPARGSFAAFYLLGRRVLAVDTVNRIPDFMQAKRLVAQRTDVDDELLANEDIPLAKLTQVGAVD